MAVDVKICGLLRPEDAAYAATHGAWRLGVIFAGGPRQIDVPRAREIVAAAAGVPVLGVFGPQPLQSMLETIASAGLAGAQLHGDHDRAVALAVHAAGHEVWSVVPVAGDRDPAIAMALVPSVVDAVLVEARVPGGAGGKGVVVDHALARRARALVRPRRFVLAGGLTADNVAAAIMSIEPDAVDVSSGIESSPGVKRRELLTRFLENVFAAHPAS